jgi:hypothetical protein
MAPKNGRPAPSTNRHHVHRHLVDQAQTQRLPADLTRRDVDLTVRPGEGAGRSPRRQPNSGPMVSPSNAM